MSKLFQGGCSPGKNREPKTRQLYWEVYSGLRNLGFQGKEFVGGTLGLLLGVSQAFSRVGYEKDDTVRIFSGLNNKNEMVHPAWQDPLMRPINASSEMACNYLFPTHDENYSKKSFDVENETTTETLTTPGAWTVQFGAANDVHFYKLITLFMDEAVMGDGWKRTGFSLYIYLYIITKKNIYIYIYTYIYIYV